jgi:hypothetical protein
MDRSLTTPYQLRWESFKVLSWHSPEESEGNLWKTEVGTIFVPAEFETDLRYKSQKLHRFIQTAPITEYLVFF